VAVVGGIAATVMLPSNLKAVGYGMIAVGATEMIENVVAMVMKPAAATTTTGTTVQGFPSDYKLGYTPQVMPTNAEVVITADGTPVR
jgi:hypothetical protein